MTDNHHQNTVFFEDKSMKGLHTKMHNWQEENGKRFLSMSIQKEGDSFCCIALTNPVLVTIVDVNETSAAAVRKGLLMVDSSRWSG